MVGRRTGRLAGALLALLVLLATAMAGDGRAGVLEPRPYDYFAKSHALLIGIDDYSGPWEPLKKAVADAREMAKALKKQGFTTEVVENPDAAELFSRVENFIYDTGRDPEARLLIWFSGHSGFLAMGSSTMARAISFRKGRQLRPTRRSSVEHFPCDG